MSPEDQNPVSQVENPRTVSCAHCGKEVVVAGFRRREVDEAAPRPSLVKCPHCRWKFEVSHGDLGDGDGATNPWSERFNI